MKFNPDFRLESIAGEYMLINTKAGAKDISAVFSINEPAAWLWKKVDKKDFDEEILVSLITGEYEVTEDVARRDVKDILRVCESYNMLIK